MITTLAAIRDVPHPAWRLLYVGQQRADLTSDISPAVLSITYHDKAEGEASEIEVELEDRLHRWQGPAFPRRGDTLQLDIGYAGALVPCGQFEIDEVELEGPPDVVHIKAISAGIMPDMRTHASRAYHGRTILQIAEEVAKRHGLTVVGAPAEPEVTLERVTQRHETDLAFLRRLANLYGYSFTLRGRQLVFEAREHLERTAPTLTITRQPTTRFRFRARTGRVFRSAAVSYHDARSKKLHAHRETASGDVPCGDTISVPQRCESGTDAKAKAKAALHGHNRHERTASLSLVGDAKVAARVNVRLTGWGQFDGMYHVDSSSHRLTRGGGYETTAELRQVEAAT